MPLFGLVVDQGERKIAFTAYLAVNFEYSFGEEDHSSASGKFCSDFTEITRSYNVLETDIVYTAIESGTSFELILYEECAALCHDLTLDYTRDDRVSREMPPAEKFVFLYSVFCVGYALCIDFYLIDQKHRLAVRKVFFKFFFVHDIQI